MVKKKIDYDKISESNILVLKTGNSVRVQFLDNGFVDTETITDDNNEPKEVDKYIYNVIDLSDNQEKELSFLAKRFVLKVKEYMPIKDKSFNINKFQFGTDKFDVDFKITPL